MEIYVRGNDTLWYYSELFQVPIILLNQSNPDITASNLFIGQKIFIPGYVTSKYTINKNDTLWTIAMKHDLSVDMLFLANPTVNAGQLQEGQEILIPSRVNQRLITDVNDYTYEKMKNDLQKLISVYPFLRLNTIGNSVLNKDLIEIQIGSGSKVVHLNGSFHANEWITTPVIMQFLNDYAMSVTNNRPIRGLFMQRLYESTNLSIVPMVNPDGVNLVLNGLEAAMDQQENVLAINRQSVDFQHWKANIRGVDLNDQFPALWEIEANRQPKKPEPRDYPGPYPLSEPESQAMATLTRERNFMRVVAFHTQGEEIYWGFEGFEPPISEIIVNEFSRVSGYEAIQYLDSYAGYKDWFIYDFRRPGFTVELGHGVNPLPIEQYPEIYEKSLGIMLANLYM